jgi:hypothetical protein
MYAIMSVVDRITPLGKRPTIASLSLGATRTFRLKRAARDAPAGASTQAAGIRFVLTSAILTGALLLQCVKMLSF